MIVRLMRKQASDFATSMHRKDAGHDTAYARTWDGVTIREYGIWVIRSGKDYMGNPLEVDKAQDQLDGTHGVTSRWQRHIVVTDAGRLCFISKELDEAQRGNHRSGWDLNHALGDKELVRPDVCEYGGVILQAFEQDLTTAAQIYSDRRRVLRL
jgi:hypothetical protein